MYEHHTKLKELLLTLIVAKNRLHHTKQTAKNPGLFALRSYSDFKKIEDMSTFKDAYKSALAKIDPKMAAEMLPLLQGHENSIPIKLSQALVCKALEYDETEITLPQCTILNFPECREQFLNRKNKINLNGTTLHQVPLENYKVLAEKVKSWGTSLNAILSPTTSLFRAQLLKWVGEDSADTKRTCTKMLMTGEDLKYLCSLTSQKVTLEDCELSGLDEESLTSLKENCEGSFYLGGPTIESFSKLIEAELPSTLEFRGISFLPNLETVTPYEHVPAALLGIANVRCNSDMTFFTFYGMTFDHIKFATLIPYVKKIELMGYMEEDKVIELIKKLANPLKFIQIESLLPITYDLNLLREAPFVRELVFEDHADRQAKWDRIQKHFEGVELPFTFRVE